MRVLQVIDSLRIGGAEVLVHDLAPRLVSRGVDCAALVLSRSFSSLESSLEAGGVRLLDTGGIDLYSPRQVPALCRWLREFDLVHVHLFPAQLWAVLAGGWHSGCTLVTTEHSTRNARRRWWLRPLDAAMYPRYACIACNSQATADELARWCPHIKSKLRIVPNGIPLELFAKAKPADLGSLGNGMIRAVFVGRLERDKDHATLLRALARVPHVHLFLVGDGPLRRQLEQQARDLRVSERVSFMGVRSDVPEVLKACDIYVHSTPFDGFGMAACEAMAAGLPVIASDVPGLAQVVHGAGILFPAGDDARLASELNQLAASKEKKMQMAEASLLRSRDFSVERTVDRYLELYESVLDRVPHWRVGA